MLTATEIAGFAGAGLAGAAYVPQVSHLIRSRCSAGISRLAFEAWLLASVLTMSRAIAIHAGAFIVLGGIQIVATALIMACAIRYKDTPCPVHLPRQPVATIATETGTAGDEPGSRRPSGPPVASATPAVLDRTPRRRSGAVTAGSGQEPDARAVRTRTWPRIAAAAPAPTLSGRAGAGRVLNSETRT